MILYPTYFSPIAQYVAISKADNLTFEVEDNYQKQTYRTRCYIYSADGRQLLNIPIQHNQNKKTKDIKIDTSFHWQKQHIKTLQIAYRSSPYFEFYEEEVLIIFDKIPSFLLDLNMKCQEVMFDLLQLEIPYTSTKEYTKKYTDISDMRFLADAKSKQQYNFDQYIQVFSDKLGFIENLSILDLLFMEGPNALNYLENQSFDLK
ncbi:MAG: WbqC family protein [Flavobacteriaceae bacterium]|nr:WbqC family protein [Flavobacteriaceae bacterium]